MSPANRSQRAALALYLLTALPVLSGAIPVLDMQRGDGRPLVESHHHPETHCFPHNHLICIQQHASQWAVAGTSPVPTTAGTMALPGIPDPPPPPYATQVTLPHPRAPPVS